MRSRHRGRGARHRVLPQPAAQDVVREIVFKGKNTAPKDTFWALRNVSFTVHAARRSAWSAATAAARARCSR